MRATTVYRGVCRRGRVRFGWLSAAPGACLLASLASLLVCLPFVNPLPRYPARYPACPPATSLLPVSASASVPLPAVSASASVPLAAQDPPRPGQTQTRRVGAASSRSR